MYAFNQKDIIVIPHLSLSIMPQDHELARASYYGTLMRLVALFKLRLFLNSSFSFMHFSFSSGVEPWSFEQHLGEAVFIPAGNPFQVRHLKVSDRWISLY